MFFKGIRIYKIEFNKKSKARNRQKSRSIQITRGESKRKDKRGRKKQLRDIKCTTI